MILKIHIMYVYYSFSLAVYNEDIFKTKSEYIEKNHIFFLVERYNELSQKNRFQSVPFGALCLYNIQCENLTFFKISQYL